MPEIKNSLVLWVEICKEKPYKNASISLITFKTNTEKPTKKRTLNLNLELKTTRDK